MQQLQLLIKYLDPSFSGSIQIKLLLELVSKRDHELLNIGYTTSLIDPPPPPPPPEENDATAKTGKKKKKESKTTDDADKAVISRKRGEPCKQCGIAVMEPPLEHDPKYIHLLAENLLLIFHYRFVQVQLTLAMFKDIHQHPAHFLTRLTTGTTIHGVIDIIINHLNKSTKVIAVFKEPCCSKEAYLNPSWSLLECGLEGSQFEYTPTRYQLYYDFIPHIIDCPILMADNGMRDVPPIVKRKLGGQGIIM